MTAARRHRVTANLFAIPFGVSGLAQCWTTAHSAGTVPAWPADVAWTAAAALWLIVLTAYLEQLRTGTSLAAELAEPTFGPFVALATITPMLLAGALGEHARGAAQGVFVGALILTLLLGGWLSGQWIISDTTLAQWHPGYFLPTVAGGLIAAATAAKLGHRSLAELMFGYGAVCWIVLGSIILTRLFTQPRLPTALIPTIAIELAPPVVAGSGWFLINGARVDAVALGLAGYALLMALVQVRLVPLFRTVPFGPPWWSFSFSYAAAVAYAIRWLTVSHPPGQDAWIGALLAAATAAIAVVGARTVLALRAGRFLPVTTAPTGATVPRDPGPVRTPAG